MSERPEIAIGISPSTDLIVAEVHVIRSEMEKLLGGNVLSGDLLTRGQCPRQDDQEKAKDENPF